MMLFRLFAAVVLTAAWALPAQAHGGGGFVYVPIYVPQVSAPTAQQVQDLANVHTVAVVSAIGRHLSLTHNGLWTESKEVDISDWKLDDYVAARVRDLLKSRFSFVDIPSDRAALAAIPNGPLSNSTTALKTYLTALPRNDVDAFIVVRPDLEYQAPGPEGLGITTGSGISINEIPPGAWANFEIDVVNARTLETLGKAYSRIQLRDGEAPSFAALVLDKSLAPTDGLALTDEQRAKLRLVFADIVNMTVTETLRALNLGVTLPAPGARTVIPIPADKAPFPQIKSVAVVSAIGEQIEFRKIATILFQTDDNLPIPDWNLDLEVQSEISASLSRRFIVKDIPVDRAALAKVRLRDSDGKWLDTVSDLPASDDVDAYVVACKQTIELGPTSDGEGVGLWRNVVAGQTGVFAYYTIALVDAHTRKIIEAFVARMPPNVAQVLPYKPEDSSLWPDTPQTATREQIDTIRNDLHDLLSASVQETLMHMLLTDSVAVHTLPAAAN